MRPKTESEKTMIAWKKQQIQARVRELLKEYEGEQYRFFWGMVNAVKEMDML